ncbi:hypothetical protein ABZ281_06560 [Streptomyces sp. NPDC006265]|uniref:hypothetical protein n=1 Tax=Streptomyces sp. NPDC006265 TaxID=3156740 RepID=UPI00339EDF81
MIGTDVARRVCRSLQAAGHRVRHFAHPTDRDLRQALGGDVAGVAILLKDDAESLRYALAVEHIRPHVTLVVTVFDSIRGHGHRHHRRQPQRQQATAEQAVQPGHSV